MCGIAGIWNLTGEPVRHAAIERFTRSLNHRGPDGAGFHTDDAAGLALGHRRLSIVDLTEAGAQPMRCADGRYHIVYNGEIYNFVELRRQLERGGYTFQTQTDTEVIVAAYEKWGEDCQQKFNGMWAFAIWDARARRLFLSRDRFGVKPLLYAEDGHRFAFASELKAFLALDGFQVRENSAALARSIEDPLAAESAHDAPFRGVRRLLPGHCMTVSPDGIVTRRWWNTLDHLITPAPSRAARAETFRELLFDAARLRLRSDVPIGIALSGGLDSSSVLCALTALDDEDNDALSTERRARIWRQAFTATFENTPLDERRYAHLVAREKHVPIEDVTIDPEIDAQRIAETVYAFEEVTMTDPTPVWSLYRAFRSRNVTVALNGDGADELLAGYLHHADFALAASGGMFRAPLRYKDLVETRYHLTGRNGPIAPSSRLQLALRYDPRLFAASAALRRFGRAARDRSRARSAGTPRASFLRASASASAEAEYTHATSIANEAHLAGLSPLGAYLYEDFHALKLPGILRMFDRAAMAHGVEIRNPFLDWRIVCYAFSCPDEDKLGGGFSKRLLREAMHGIVPEPIRTRRTKIGFSAPLPQWFAGPRRDWLRNLVNEPDFLESDIWNGPAIRTFVEHKRDGAPWNWGEGEAIWPFVNAHLWRRHVLHH